MARRQSGVLIRRLFGNGSKPCPCPGLLLHHHHHHYLPKLLSNSTQTLTLTSTPNTTPSPSPSPSPSSISKLLHSPNHLHFLQHRRPLSSASAASAASAATSGTASASAATSGTASAISLASPSPMVNIWEAKEVKKALKDIKRRRLSSVLYFTRDWCFLDVERLTPTIRKLREQFPHVTIYKIIVTSGDKDMAHLTRDLVVEKWPSFHFYQNGKWLVDEKYVSKDCLIDTFEKLYRYVIPVETTQPSSSSVKGKMRTQQLFMQAKKDENGIGVEGGWKVRGSGTFSQQRYGASLSQWRGAATLAQQSGRFVESVDSSNVPSLHQVMRAVESLRNGHYDYDKLWWFAKGLFISQPEKRVIFSKLTEPKGKLAWLLAETAEE